MSFGAGFERGARTGTMLLDVPLQEEERRQAMRARELAITSAGLANADQEMVNAEKKRALAVAAGAREAAANAQGTPEVVTVTENGGYTLAPRTQNSSAALWQQEMGEPVQPVLSNLEKRRFEQAKAATTAAASEVSAAPVDPQSLDGLVAAKEQAGIQAAAQPTVTKTVTPAKPANPMAAYIQYYETTDPEKAAAMRNQVIQQAKDISVATGNLQDGADLLNYTLGTNYNTTKVSKYQIIKNGDQPMGILDESRMSKLTDEGVSAQDAYKQSFVQIAQGGTFPVFASAVAALPAEERSADDILGLAATLGVDHKVAAEVVKMYQAERGGDQRDKALVISEQRALVAEKRALGAEKRANAKAAGSGGRPSSGTTEDLGLGNAKRKVMPTKTQDNLREGAEKVDTMTNLVDGFRSEYAGKPFKGRAELFIKKHVGTKTGEVLWWSDYDGFVNRVRNDLFGAALTNTEKAEFNKLIVGPGAEATVVQRNIARQREIAEIGLARLSRAAAMQHDPKMVEALTGRKIPTAEATKAKPVIYEQSGVPKKGETVVVNGFKIKVK